MLIKFTPNFTITPKIAKGLMRIEAAQEKSAYLPLTPQIMASLRESAKLVTTHYSTMIEGNRLSTKEVEEVLKHKGHFPGRERDEQEVKGYYAALAFLETLVARGEKVSEKAVKKFHALVMNINGETPYREGQNVIRESQTGAIVYMPPEAKDVAGLMKGLIDWIHTSSELPCPIVAAITHYQFATIHPYYDGNGRTARLLTTLVLHLGGYDLKGLYSLEEYYARNLLNYYHAISIGPSHNYYLGRAEAEITPWVEYFIEGMALSFEKVIEQMEGSKHEKDDSKLLRELDPKKRKILELFEDYAVITSKQIGHFYGFKPSTSSQLCRQWVKEGFIEIVDPSRKARKYQLSKKYKKLISN
ncbi:MAG: Fic family protein [Chlamydiia bacterium]|nr:Fic family protein [Chlamydiia bacterium]